MSLFTFHAVLPLHSLTQPPQYACQVGRATCYSHFRDEGPGEVKVTRLKSNTGCLSTISGRTNTSPLATLPSFLARCRHHESITGLFPPDSGCTSGSSSTQPFQHLGPPVRVDAQITPAHGPCTTSCQRLSAQAAL